MVGPVQKFDTSTHLAARETVRVGISETRATTNWKRSKPGTRSRRDWREWREAEPRWEGDHIVPVADGGRECGLANLRLLCRPCHVAVTTAWSHRRRSADASPTGATQPPLVNPGDGRLSLIVPMYPRLRPRHLAVVITLTFAMASVVAAQSRATTADLIAGVVDDSGGVLPGALITVTSPDTGLSRTGTTGSDGRLTVPALPPGRYAVDVELAGFAAENRDVVISLGTVTDLDVTLHLASITTQINVAEAAPLVDVRRSVVAGAIGDRQIAELPVDRRNYISFAAIVPGVSFDRTPNQGSAESSGLTFAGQGARANNITVDGLDNNDDAVGGVRAVFNQDAVREFQVLVSSYSAEFGKAAGGVVNIVTKSGSNHVEGTVFGFYRDRSLNARGYFDDFDAAGRRIDAPKSPFSQGQFGATLGGPIRRNQTFAFGSVERLAIDDSNAVTIDDRTTVLHPFLGIPLGTPAGILRQAGFPVEVGAVPFAVRSTTALGKVDHRVSDGTSLAVRFNVADGVNENSQPFGGIVARSRGGLLDTRDHMIAGLLSSVRGSRIVNEFRVQIARRDQVLQSLDPACGGPCVTENLGGPGLDVTGVANVGRHQLTPQSRRNTRYQVLDTFSYEMGRHRLKTGIDINAVDNRETAVPLQFGGTFVFVNIPAALASSLGLPGPVSAIQAVALGLPVSYVQGYGRSTERPSFRDVSTFVQDDWRATGRLTLRLGARYQKQSWPKGPYTSPGYPGSYEIASGSDYPAPRLGVAWDPAGDGRMAINAAYGLFFANQFHAPVGTTGIVDGQALHVVMMQGSPAIAAWRMPGHRVPTTTLAALPSITVATDPAFATPRTHHASVGVNRQIGRDVSISISGVFLKGSGEVGVIDYNPIIPSLGAGRRPLDVNGMAGTSASVGQYTPWGERWYRGLLVSIGKRFSRGSQALLAYTLSSAEDSIADFFGNPPQEQGRGRNPADPDGLPLGFDPSLERGPSLQDQRHRLVLSGLYELPWQLQVTGILTAGSARPYNILAGIDLNGDGNANATSPDRPRAVPSDPSTSVGRNAGRLPGDARLDVRLSKRFPIGGHATVSAIVDVLNALNATNYTDVNRVFGSGAYPSQPLPTFGQFTQAGPPRQIQLGARVTF
ncbi:MAG: TonB-dependent receptor [Acidobacteria bacterium]|nr:TonB-dependent receptor [Acidobacteriota bacterium]